MSATNLTLDLPGPVLRTLLDLCGVEEAAIPGIGDGQPLDALQVNGLVTLGVLEHPVSDREAVSPAFRDVARTLERPARSVAVRLWTGVDDLSTEVHFRSTDDLEDGVSLTPGPVGFRLRNQVDASALAALVQRGFLERWIHAPSQTFRAWLTPAAAEACFAVVDWIDAGGGLDTTTGALRPVAPVELGRFIASGATRGNARCFGPYVTLALGCSTESGAAELEKSLDTLVGAGLLMRTSDGFLPCGALVQLVHRDASVDAALQWHIVTRDESGDVEVQHRVILGIGGRLLLALDRVDGGLVVHVPSASSLRADFLAAIGRAPAGSDEDELDDAGQVSIEDRSATPPKKFCTSCGARLRLDASFCTSCGTAHGAASGR